MFVDVLYLLLCTWTLYFSLSSLPYHPIRVGDCSCKTLVINRDFWYAHSSKRWLEWQLALVSLWKLARCACFLLCALIINQCFYYPHSLNLDICCLLCFPYIGLSLLTIFMLCLLAFPQTLSSDAQDTQRNLPCNFWVLCPTSPLNKAK